MAHIDVSATAKWELSLDIMDADGAVDMTGKTCSFVVSSANNAEICRASTDTGATGSIVIVAGPDDTGGIKSRLNVEIPTSSRAPFTVARDFIFVEGELGVLESNDWVWLGAVDLKVWAGPTWTGATGATTATGA